MILLRDDARQTRRFEALLQEKLMNRLPADLARARAKQHDDSIPRVLQAANHRERFLHVLQRPLLQNVITPPSGARKRQFREHFRLRNREIRAIRAVFPHELPIVRMETAEIIHHGLDDIAVVLFDDE